MNAIISVADLVRTSGVAFGTSGARGQVAAMTDESAAAILRASFAILSTKGSGAGVTRLHLQAI